MEKQRSITLKHILLDGKKYIGLKFYPDKVLQALAKELPNPKWHSISGCVIIPNNKENLNAIFQKFRGVAWIDCRYFFTNRPINKGNEALNVDHFRKRELAKGRKRCPEEYLQKLELRKYAFNTAKTYISLFEDFINHYKEADPLELDENDIRVYLQGQVQKGKSNSYLNQAVNAINHSMTDFITRWY